MCNYNWDHIDIMAMCWNSNSRFLIFAILFEWYWPCRRYRGCQTPSKTQMDGRMDGRRDASLRLSVSWGVIRAPNSTQLNWKLSWVERSDHCFRLTLTTVTGRCRCCETGWYQFVCTHRNCRVFCASRWLHWSYLHWSILQHQPARCRYSQNDTAAEQNNIGSINSLSAETTSQKNKKMARSHYPTAGEVLISI